MAEFGYKMAPLGKIAFYFELLDKGWQSLMGPMLDAEGVHAKCAIRQHNLSAIFRMKTLFDRELTGVMEGGR
ncbi:MAG: hypothetical protein D6722_19820 [Bacteroidetes bacterium]|nr:MAG: hypothetical protein D6722_19820 [Bacteroidota bacterium]